MKQQFLDLNGLTELVTYLKKSITEQKEILPYASNKLFPSTGNVNCIYIDTATNSIYRWDSSNKKYEILAKAVKSVSISESTENGKITLTVDGNKTTVPIHGLGSAAYTNSSAYSPAGHTHTKAQVGLGNVDNTADKDKSVKHANTADSATAAGTATTTTNVNGENATVDAARHVWFSDSATETKRNYNDNFKYNPATNTVTTNISGSAASANSVLWSGVTGKPSTFTPSAHTHPYLSALSASGRTITYTKGDGTTGTITTQDTWRGIQNNLTSTSTTDSLSAAQGKILKGLVDGKLSLSGGTMTGNISYKGSKATYEMIKFIDNSSDTYGNGIAIGGGGLTIIGGGKSSDVIKNAASSGGEERLVLANDGAIEFYTNCQDGIDKSVHTTIDNTGLFSGIASSANLINCTQLTNQDLNTLKDPGKFYYAAGSNSCTNTGQASGTAFGLYVGRNAEGYRYQKMITTGNLIYYRTYNSTSWSVWSTNIDSTNYTSYAPTKTGAGASGTWGISVTGNAATATKLATARSINGTNFDGSGNITTATWGTARNVTIGSTKKSVNGGADVSWSLSEIGAAAASHSHSYLPLSGGTMSGTAMITWPDSGNWGNSNKNVTFPVIRGGLSWIGQSDGIQLYAVETSNNNLELYLKFTDDNSNGLSVRNKDNTQTARISATGEITASKFIGNLAGTASSASAVPWSGVTGKPSSMPASDVYAWAKASTKPSYSWGEITGKPGTFTPASHSHSYITASLSSSAVPTKAADGRVEFYYNVNNGLANNMPSTNNANAIISLSRHAGDYPSQLGFSSDGNIYYREGVGTTAWKTIITSSNYTSYTTTKTGGGASGTWGINVSGGAAYPTGFNSRATSATWGNQTGILITDWHTSNGGDIQFRDNSGQLNVITDGFFYQNEGRNLVLDSVNYSNYAATKSHTHNYAGSSSAGGNANAAVKLATARKIGSASFDGTADITLSQMGLNVPVEITKADYLAKKKAGTLNANTYYNVIDEYDSANVINDSSVTANSAFSSTKSEKTYAKKSTLVTTTLTASKWTGSSAPYTYVLPVSGVTSSNIVEIDYASNASSAAIEAYQNAMLADGGQTTNQITIKATEKPTVDIPITIVIRNDL